MVRMYLIRVSHMRILTSQITVKLTICLGKQQRKRQSSALLVRFTGSLWGESTGHRWIPLTKGPVMRKVFPCHNVSIFRKGNSLPQIDWWAEQKCLKCNEPRVYKHHWLASSLTVQSHLFNIETYLLIDVLCGNDNIMKTIKLPTHWYTYFRALDGSLHG